MNILLLSDSNGENIAALILPEDTDMNNVVYEVGDLVDHYSQQLEVIDGAAVNNIEEVEKFIRKLNGDDVGEEPQESKIMDAVARLHEYHELEEKKKIEETEYAERIDKKAAELFAPVLEMLAQLYDAGVTDGAMILPDPRSAYVKAASEYNLRTGGVTYSLFLVKPSGGSEVWDEERPYRMRIGTGELHKFLTPNGLVDGMLKQLHGQLSFPKAKKPEAKKQEEDSGPGWA